MTSRTPKLGSRNNFREKRRSLAPGATAVKNEVLKTEFLPPPTKNFISGNQYNYRRNLSSFRNMISPINIAENLERK